MTPDDHYADRRDREPDGARGQRRRGRPRHRLACRCRASASSSWCGVPAAPIVFTGAMRPYELRSTDALQNLTEALLAVQLVAPGVYVGDAQPGAAVPRRPQGSRARHVREGSARAMSGRLARRRARRRRGEREEAGARRRAGGEGPRDQPELALLMPALLDALEVRGDRHPGGRRTAATSSSGGTRNEPAAAILGYTLPEMLAVPVIDTIAPEQRTSWRSSRRTSGRACPSAGARAHRAPQGRQRHHGRAVDEQPAHRSGRGLRDW